jgi:hypothetical protein
MATNAWGEEIHYNSIKQVIRFLERHPFQTAREIREVVFSDYVASKKHSDMLARALRNGKIKRTEVAGKPYKFIYYV